MNCRKSVKNWESFEKSTTSLLVLLRAGKKVSLSEDPHWPAVRGVLCDEGFPLDHRRTRNPLVSGSLLLYTHRACFQL